MVTTVGLLGCGRWGRNILRDLVALGARVVVADPDPAARAAARAAGALEGIAEHRDLPPVDGLVVATPATTHADLVEAWLPRGLPIFVEKPFTTDAARAAQLAREGDGRLFVMHVFRYHPGVEALRQLVRSGELGPVDMLRSLRVGWTSPRGDVDPTWTLAPHDLSIALEVLGHLPEPRAAFVERRGAEVVGLLGVLGEHPRVVLEVSTRYPTKRRELRLHCRDGVVGLDAAAGRHLEVAHDQDAPPGALPPTRRIPFDPEPPLRRELAAFLDHLRGGPPPRTSALEAARLVATMEALRELAGIPPGRAEP